MVNKVILLGNVGRDPEVGMTNGGTKVAKFTLATTSGDETQWHNLAAFKNVAEYVDKYVKKGDKLFIEGTIKYKEYTNNEGQKKNYTQIIALSIRSLSPKPQQEDDILDDFPI
jgi:single-strand DNA-binding protein